MNLAKRALVGMGSVITLMTPIAAFAAIPVMTTPAFETGAPALWWETVGSIIQFPFSLFSDAENLYMLGGIVILGIALAVAMLFRRRMHL